MQKKIGQSDFAEDPKSKKEKKKKKRELPSKRSHKEKVA